ncbi:hypothetical protein K491DRAFT_292064 [Lophiostoma macrostomum CBS 122681]|uniref:Uncharacterized protein n=1 Tax=Lophiostoma macrostomum CBS 122681 TaxID=1314788 RepID=A0A6A6SIS3_9PLEO|nr:hypothetical protein K491DRAFT_292064 [Lophiostoma macrostomum CBS 122681]
MANSSQGLSLLIALSLHDCFCRIHDSLTKGLLLTIMLLAHAAPLVDVGISWPRENKLYYDLESILPICCGHRRSSRRSRHTQNSDVPGRSFVTSAGQANYRKAHPAEAPRPPTSHWLISAKIVSLPRTSTPSLVRLVIPTQLSKPVTLLLSVFQLFFQYLSACQTWPFSHPPTSSSSHDVQTSILLFLHLHPSPLRPRSLHSSVSRPIGFGSTEHPPPITADESPPRYSEHDPYGTRWRRFRVKTRIRSKRATVLVLEVLIVVKHIVLIISGCYCLNVCLKSLLRRPHRSTVVQ